MPIDATPACAAPAVGAPHGADSRARVQPVSRTIQNCRYRPRLLRLRTWLLAAACLLPALGPGALAADAPFREVLAEPELLGQLQRGGYVLYLRHGTTDNSRADGVPVDLADCNTQRVLNDEGRAVARQIGQAMRQARIPVGEIRHSPLCRTTETARLAFPDFKGPMAPERHLMYTANLTSEEKIPVIAATRRLVSTPVTAGSNRLIVAHAPNMADLMGYFVKPEGTLVVLRPLGEGKFDYVASIHPTHWSRLLKREPR